MTMGEAVAKRIDEYLNIKGMSLYKLAKESGLPVSTLQNLYRRHTKSPTLTVIFKISLGLGVSVTDFLACEIFEPYSLELD
jgi:DNA-binding helix-turn-helix protein